MARLTSFGTLNNTLITMEDRKSGSKKALIDYATKQVYLFIVPTINLVCFTFPEPNIVS